MGGWAHYKPGASANFRATPEGKTNDRPPRKPYRRHETGMPDTEVQARVDAAKARARRIHGVEEEA